jgi:hypothetical protein
MRHDKQYPSIATATMSEPSSGCVRPHPEHGGRSAGSSCSSVTTSVASPGDVVRPRRHRSHSSRPSIRIKSGSPQRPQLVGASTVVTVVILGLLGG